METAIKVLPIFFHLPGASFVLSKRRLRDNIMPKGVIVLFVMLHNCEIMRNLRVI